MKISTLQEFKQAAFNGMWRGLKSQGWAKSLGSFRATCRYRSGDDPKARVCCAVGWLIPDDQYVWMVENGEDGQAINDLDPKVLAQPLATYLRRGRVGAMDFLRRAQVEHDSSYGDMEIRFRALAEEHNLTIPDGDE